ncbi:LOW QUALITY PROTEIN: receptor-type guanylate cyclase Gyc76C-like [Uloborus diversus]|uniref:LOW QUALITY PROTEIN: receptor-type guanylate cyclase Gyc76C-like n=1 Tax=Uloborus diversus TaxID=327109 RepID=UPI002409FC9E|nr:LOW QUALITY PROTEIN: receptor-type guanylate cyclase Gyc76C-like [Uloborus diversus]
MTGDSISRREKSVTVEHEECLKCADSRVSDKNFYRTFARTNPSDKGVVRSILGLLRYYRWRKFSIVSEQSNPYMTIAKSLEQQASHYPNFTINHKGIIYYANIHVCCEDGKPCCNDAFAKVVEETYKSTRVYVFFGRTADLIQLMTMLQMKKGLDTGEYVIIYIDLEAYAENSSFKYFWRADMRQHLVDMAMKAARSLLVIVPSPPHDKAYTEFENKVRDYNMKEPFAFPNTLPFAKHITEFAAYLYDSVILYAEALAATLEENVDPKNGSYIIQKVISRGIYRSVTGAWMHIDENGDVEGNYTVLALQPAPHNLSLKGFRGEKNLSHVMLPMARFQYDEQSNEPIFTLLDVEINWDAPLDEPPCGFDGSVCVDPPGPVREVISGILFVALVILSVGCWIMYKKWKYEQEIAGLLWKISLPDVQRYGSDGIISSLSKTSINSQVSLESKLTGQTFTQTAFYKGTLVATKILKFKSKNIEIPRESMKEMKTMRELHHDNINPFIGACLQPYYIILVTEYCAKGSLKDILENPDIKLDHMFIASLVFDLIKGMIFLHDSDLKVHGNLKSSNCVVTSRWVLQVTDYGVRELFKTAEEEMFLNYDCYNKLLWKAPEILRNPSEYPKGTQKSDIYSFSIILHEILLRKGPFGISGLPPEEIIARIKEGPDKITGRLFRPTLEEAEVQDYVLHTMTECWSEIPELRPDFRHIKDKLKRMKDGITSNIMDNMMDMMEKYANNLEQLVEERTSLLAEEQKKTEALLHRMLPKSVAEQLMRGEAVSPESFDSVTIYFSDIVGFTEMSASSTPMEVVTFLNDLYTVFDSIIGNYDVYKVETIGDAYMVVSGLPIRNGEQHAAEISSMALDLLEAVKTFKIRHKPSQTLKLRIGIHSGPVVAGVVGLTMPRYCLFGDTVNTASRMESNGEPLKIHISEQCWKVLERVGGYEVQPRGLVKMKGKGEMKTYWLIGHDIISEKKRHILKTIILPPPLFNLRETENRRRSPKTEFPRRNPITQPHRSVDDTTGLPNGSIPSRGMFLRMAQDSPRISKRASQTIIQTRDTFQAEPWDGNEWGVNAAYDGSNNDKTKDIAPHIERSRSNVKDVDMNSVTTIFDDLTKPLINIEKKQVENFRNLNLKKQSWKKSWSADELDMPKMSLKEWFTNTFCNNVDHPDVESRPHAKNTLHTVRETEKEESAV